MRRLLHASLLAAVLLLAGLTPGPSNATTMVPRSVEDLTRASESVVRATTLSVRSAWDAPHRNIISTVRLRALEKLAGRIEPGTEFDVEYFGGVVDGIEMDVIGAPEFRTGEEVVLFLRRDTRGVLTTVDMAQGKLEVTRDAGLERLTRRDLQTVEWARGEGPDRVRNLAALRTRIGALLHILR